MSYFYPRNIEIELMCGGEHSQYIELKLLDKICCEIERWPSIETIWLRHFCELSANPKLNECLERVNRSKFVHSIQIMNNKAFIFNGDKEKALLDIPVNDKIDKDVNDYSGNEEVIIPGKSKEVIFGGCPFVEKDYLYFTLTGKAKPCCTIYNEQFNIGSIMEESMGQLLNNDKMSDIRHYLRLDRRDKLDCCMNCPLSLARYLSEKKLREFWIDRDEQQLVDNHDERRYLFGEVVPELQRVVRVDLGCGLVKQPGFIGIDRFALPGVDIIADMNKRLPMDDNSVDYLLASHSLEHAEDLIFTMQEIYRICKHRSLVCIVAPYYHTSLNMANPYHKQVFNEHTPRFFTTTSHTLTDKKDYEFPHAPNWGIAESDNSDCKMDFRCLRIEYFYFPEYRLLDENEKRKLRQTSINVVDQIIYHLLVVKEDIPNEEIEDMARTIEYQEPAYVSLRRCRETIEDLKIENEKLKCVFEKARVKAQELELNLQLEIEQKNQELEDQKVQIEQKNQELELQFKHLQLEKDKKIHQLVLEQVNNSFGRYARISERFRRIFSKSPDLSGMINLECRPILEASILQSASSLNNNVLGISAYIRSNEIFPYKIKMQDETLKGLKTVLSCLGVIPENIFPLAIEILSEEESILRSVSIDPRLIKNNIPFMIEFEPLQACFGKSFWVRFVGLKGIEKYGIRIYEWQRYSRLLKTKLDRKLFAELICN